MTRNIALSAGLVLLFLLCVSSVTAQTLATGSVSKGNKHEITVTNMNSGSDSVLVVRILNQYQDRVTNTWIDLAQQKLVFYSDMNSKDMLQALFKWGYLGYYFTDDGKKIMMQNSGELEVWDAK